MLILSDEEIFILILEDDSTILSINNIISIISDFYYLSNRYRDGFSFFKRNPDISHLDDYLSYMIYFNEYNINVPKYKDLIINIIKYKLMGHEYISSTIIKSTKVCSCLFPGCSRYCKYKYLLNTYSSKTYFMELIYNIFLKGSYDYNLLIESILVYERIDIINLILERYEDKELEIIKKKIIESREKDKLEIIRSLVKSKCIDVRYLSEISEYHAID
ncbi:uncharacterized protein VNE69_12124 [Vairimorpha necatrix]|uniref:Uncharacterized protein n=1 Tax=Vairimorpha necatrix TaxID=6039 RepID=A0AAX4JGN3_9MICR